MAEVDRHDGYSFAERPTDLVELIAYWNEHGSMSSHAEMIAFNVEKKLREHDPDRDAARPLTRERAHAGATMLVASLFFTRKIRSYCQIDLSMSLV
jgi:hypothetical protein